MTVGGALPGGGPGWGPVGLGYYISVEQNGTQMTHATNHITSLIHHIVTSFSKMHTFIVFRLLSDYSFNV